MWDQPTGRPMRGTRSSGSSGHLMTIGHYGLAGPSTLSFCHFTPGNLDTPRQPQDTQHEGKKPQVEGPVEAPIRAQ